MSSFSLAEPTGGRTRSVQPRGLYDANTNGYSHVVIAEAPARHIYIAGQGGENARGELSPDFAQQVAQALRNLATALDAARAAPSDVVKLTVLVVDHTQDRLGVFVQALRAMWGEASPPACTLIPVPRLALDGMLFEIEATAVIYD